MPGFAESIDLEVPSAYAFDFLADPSTATIIDPAILEYAPEELPMRLGTHNRIRLRVWGVPVRAESVVRAWEPGERMVMENVRPARPVRTVATHSFEAGGADRCRYTWAVEVHPVGLFGRIAAPAFARFMERNARAQQQRLKAEVERRWQDRA